MRVAGKLITIISVIGLVVIVGGGIVLSVMGFITIANAQGAPRTDFVGSTQVQVTDGEKFSIWYRAGQTTPDPDACIVTRADGSELEREGFATASTTFDGEDYSTEGHYTPAATETVTVMCADSLDRTVAPSLSIVSIFMASGGMLVAFFGGSFFFVTLIVGIVLWVAGNRRRRQLANGPYPRR